MTGGTIAISKIVKKSYNENINFMLETRAISQMKFLLILIESYKNTFAKNQYLILFWSPESWKGPENDDFGPISYLDSVKKYKSKSFFYHLFIYNIYIYTNRTHTILNIINLKDFFHYINTWCVPYPPLPKTPKWPYT